MKFVDEFRDPALARKLLDQIAQLGEQVHARYDRPLQVMEFCGGHTHTIFRYGLENLLPDWIELVHGPGCPVCVLPMGRIDDCIAIAEHPEVIFATFGDAMRVPGSRGSLLDARAAGADVRMVYSPADALLMAQENPEREVVFFALGFETTMPSTALTLRQAKQQGVSNFSVLCAHITTVPVVQALLSQPDLLVDGFIAPGHVCMVMGAEPLAFVAEDHHKPIVISGFEPLDILESLHRVVAQLAAGEAALDNSYRRVVHDGGNAVAQQAMAEVYQPRDSSDWRGLGAIADSGVSLSAAYQYFDAEQRFGIRETRIADPESCRCGDVLKGVIRPWQCEAFGRECTPDRPLGALMVSSEGSCAAYYKYGDPAELAARRLADGVIASSAEAVA